MKSILIIGGTGCISSAVVQACLNNGMAVTVINRGSRPHLIPEEVNLIKADKDNKEAIKKGLEGKHYDAVIDFLCYSPDQLKASVEFYSHYADQYVFISSCSAFDFRQSDIVDETSPQGDERWWYSINKMNSEKLLKSLSANLGINYTIVRPSITYGDTRIPYGITPPYGKHGTIIQRVLHEKPIIRWDGGETSSNMMRVEDFSRAFVKLLGNPVAYNEDFNICSEKAYTFNEVLDSLEEKLGKKIIKFDVTKEEYASRLPERSGEIIVGRGKKALVKRTKFNKLFPDFKEEYDLKAGICKTVEAYISQNWIDGMDYAFDGDCDRIIKEISKKRKGKIVDIKNLKFIPYLSGDEYDKKKYESALLKNSWNKKLRRFAGKIKRKVIG